MPPAPAPVLEPALVERQSPDSSDSPDSEAIDASDTSPAPSTTGADTTSGDTTVGSGATGTTEHENAPASTGTGAGAGSSGPAYGTVPPCVSLCMARGNISGCSNSTDFSCLCSNEVYQNSVAKCWRISCTESDVQFGMSYSVTACSAFGVTPQTVATGTGAPIAYNTIIAPVAFSRAAWNIQAVMSSLCSLVLVIAITFGIVNCRNMMKREQQTSTRWTNVLSNDTKRGQTTTGGRHTFSQMMRAGPSRSDFASGRGPLDSVLETDSHFTLSFPSQAHSHSHSHSQSLSYSQTRSQTSSLRPSINRPYRGLGLGVNRGGPRTGGGEPGRRRFSSRLQPEEWEMSERTGEVLEDSLAARADGLLPVPSLPSPTSPTSPTRKGKEREKDMETETEAEGEGMDARATDENSTHSTEPQTPTTAGLSEYGSTTHLRKVAG